MTDLVKLEELTEVWLEKELILENITLKPAKSWSSLCDTKITKNQQVKNCLILESNLHWQDAKCYDCTFLHKDSI